MIKVSKLIKKYGTQRAVNDVSFDVQKGEVMGLLGPNGAGKSTTIKTIVGFLPVTSGEIYLNGHDVFKEPLQSKKSLGYLPESASCYADLTVREYLTYMAALHGLRGKHLNGAVDLTIDRCFLSGVKNQLIETLSKGYRHRTCLAQSIVHDPEIIIFDEPTDGLDPNQKQEIRHLIREMSQTKAMIISTHILDEVETLCDKVVILDRGEVIAKGSPEQLKRQSSLYGAIHAVFSMRLSSDAVEEVLHIESVSSISPGELTEDGWEYIIEVEVESKISREETMTQLLDYFRDRRSSPQEYHYNKGDLGEVFRTLTYQK